MAWSFVQKLNFTRFDPSGTSVAFSGNVTAGNKIIVLIQYSYPPCFGSVTDTQGNTYTLAYALARPSTANSYVGVYIANVASTAANSVSFSFFCGNLLELVAMEYSGLDTSPIDQTNNQDNPGATSLSTGSITTTTANELILCFYSTVLARTYSGPSGTLRYTDTWTAITDQNQASAGSVMGTISINTSDPYASFGFIFSFKQAAGGATTVKQLAALGVG